MKRALLFLVFGIFISGPIIGQIKIGDNPQNIDATSVLELESNSRVLVITRINTAQMNAIVPSAGAIVYNTDLQCIHYYDGTQWINVCEEVGGIPNLTTDPLVNTNSTLVITPNGENNHIEVAPNSIRTEQIVDGGINGDDIQDNSIGQSKIGNDAVGRNEIAENAVGLEALDTDQITLSNFNNTPGFITGAEIVSNVAGNVLTDNGGAFYDNSAILNSIVANTVAIAADGDTNSSNEILSNAEIQGNELVLTEAGNETRIDLSVFNNTGSDNQNLTGANLSPTNILTIDIEDGSSTTVDLNSLSGTGTDNQNLEAATLSPTNILTIDIEDGNSTSVDLSTLSGTGTDSQQLTLTGGNILTLENGGTVNLNPFLDDTDEQQLSIAGNRISLTDGGFVDLPAGTVDTDEQQLTLASNILTLEDGGTPISLVPYLDNTDEQQLSIAGNRISLTDGGFVDLPAGTVDTDEQQLSLEAGNLLTLQNGGIPINLTPFLDNTDEQQLTLEPGNLLTLENDGTPIDLTPYLDDTDNQTITDFTFDDTSNILALTIDGGNTDTADLSALAGGGSQDLASVLSIGSSAGNSPINDLLDPTLPQDAATQNYVEARIATILATGGVDGVVTNAFLSGTEIDFIGSNGGFNGTVDLDPIFATDAELIAAIALKEDTANKSNDGTLIDNSVVDFPTEQAVKTYVDTEIAGAAADDDITAVSFDGTDLKVDEGTTSFSADISALDDSAAIAIVQADVDANETATNSAIALKEDTANKSSDVNLADATNTLFPTELAVKTYVDAEIAGAADDDITAVSFDGTDLTVDEGTTSFSVDISALDDSAAIAIVQADVDANETAANTAIALKEDTANKSSDVNLADATNTLFPTELAVKTYVDTEIAGAADDDITAVSFDGTDLTVDEGATSFSADISALDDSAAIAIVQADVDANETATNSAIALKEDTANKSSDVNLADATNTLFPTELAVKTYVDTQIAGAAADDDITAVSFDGTDLRVDEGATFFSANISALDDSAAIAIVQADVDANETATNSAIALKEDTANKSNDGTLIDNSVVDFPTEQAVKTYVDTEIAGAAADDDITAVSFDGTDLKVDEGTTSFSADISALDDSAAIAIVQADVDANETATNSAIALKEDTANKSTDTNLGNSDALFPSQNAVKTYVDTEIAGAAADDDITAVSFDGTDLKVDEGTTSFSADISALDDSAAIAIVQADVDANETATNSAIALKEDTANKSTDTNLGNSDALFPSQNAVKTYVDTEIAGAAADDDITAVSFDGTDLKVDEGTTSFSADISALDDSAAIAIVQADVDANETATNSAIALKEDTANKSTDTNLGNSDALFPSQNAVKTYVDTEIAGAAADDDITAVSFDGTDLKVDEGTTSFSADISALDDSAAIAIVQADVDANETATNSAIALKEDTANKSTDTNLGNSDALFPSQNAVKTYVDTEIAAVGGGSNLSTSNLTQTDSDRTYDLSGGNLRITGTGNVRIGTSPAVLTNKLHVEGTIRAEGIRNTFGTLPSSVAYSFDNDSDTGMNRAAVDQLGLVTSGNEALRIDASQNVGIGITNPQENLHVAGNIRTDGSFLSLDPNIGIPDYVFEKYFLGSSTIKDYYNFPSLEEIEAYVKRNYHLPGIKSSKQVKKDGFWNLSESNIQNLEKIEELFLHTIEQEKKIDQLKSENESITEELDILKKELEVIKNWIKKN